MNLMKDINDLYKEICKPLRKEIEEGRKRSEDGKISHVHGLAVST
jgi:hypothetical protein